MRFSERVGVKTPPGFLQLNEISVSLKNRLWNSVYHYVFDHMLHQSGTSGMMAFSSQKIFMHSLWSDFLKEPLDEMPTFISDTVDMVKKRFNDLTWNETYDFIEFFLSTRITSVALKKALLEIDIQKVLQEEYSGYRIINHEFAPITSEIEIQEVESAIQKTNGQIPGAASHLEQSLKLFSQKPNPDFRNSIKEAISAVESVCKFIVKDENADLSRALKKIESEIKIHGALKEGFQKIYGYSSGEQGIRHGMVENNEPEFEDAKFMIVACSAFVNYLISKASKLKNGNHDSAA